VEFHFSGEERVALHADAVMPSTLYLLASLNRKEVEGFEAAFTSFRRIFSFD
jgi:hypothetical protein